MILYMICLLPLAVVRNQVRSQRLNDLVVGTEHIFIDVVSCSCFHQYSSFSSFIRVPKFSQAIPKLCKSTKLFHSLNHSVIHSTGDYCLPFSFQALGGWYKQDRQGFSSHRAYFIVGCPQTTYKLATR